MKPHRLSFEALEHRLVLDSVGLEPMPLESFAGGQIASTAGMAHVDGRDFVVEVLFIVPTGAKASEAAAEALRNQGARPFQSAEYVETGLVWDQFFDGTPGNDFVTQYYNGANDPTGGGGLTALQNSHSTWNAVTSSRFEFSYGGETTRSPSLVRESPGPQTLDGFNDVAWMRLNGFGTLAVTWFDTLADEADMALNTQYGWATNGGDFDVETVMLHENGHVLGLGHSEVAESVMYAYYSGVRRDLHPDDIAGISAKYPAEAGFDYDVAVVDVSAPSSVEQGVPVTVDVVVENQGAYTETFSVSLTDTYDDQRIQSQDVMLDAGASAVVSFEWNTTGEDFVSHTLVAQATLGGDQDSSDDSLSTDVIVTNPNATVAITSISPDEGNPGARLTVTIVGEWFSEGANVDFGSRIAVQSMTFVNSTQLEVGIKIHPRAALGERDVTVTNPDSSSATLPGGFYVGTRSAAIVGSQADELDALYQYIARLRAAEHGNVGNAGLKDSNKFKDAVDYALEYL